MSIEALRNMDSRIAAGLGRAGLVDTATIAGIEVPGYYVEEFVEEGDGEEAVAGMIRTFDCRSEDLPDTLEPDDYITVTGYGEFRYLRKQRHGNDRVFLLLGTQL